jgi:hypothetical protein
MLRTRSLLTALVLGASQLLAQTPTPVASLPPVLAPLAPAPAVPAPVTTAPLVFVAPAPVIGDAVWAPTVMPRDAPSRPLAGNRNFSNFIGFMSNPAENIDPAP